MNRFEFSFLSLNLWNGGRLWSPLTDFLRRQSPDIMLLQEAYDGTDPQLEPRLRTTRELAQVFPHHYQQFFAVYQDTRSSGHLIEDGQLTLSRWPLQAPRMTFFDVPYGQYDQDAMTDFSQFPAGLGSVEVVLPTGQTLLLLNLHGPVDFDGLVNTPRRQAMMRVVELEVKTAKAAGKLVILGGDSNAQAANSCFDVISEYLQPVFPAGSLTTTFNMLQKTNPGYATAAVDTLWISPGLQVKSAACLEVNVSDHLPLVVRLSVGKE